MHDTTYCTRSCPNVKCFCNKVNAPNDRYTWYADRWKEGICPEEAKEMEEKKLEPWEERFVNEYKELKDRREKLGAMLEKWNLGQLDFTPKCSYELLWKQYCIMGDYMSVLLERAEIEGIEL